MPGPPDFSGAAPRQRSGTPNKVPPPGATRRRDSITRTLRGSWTSPVSRQDCSGTSHLQFWRCLVPGSPAKRQGALRRLRPVGAPNKIPVPRPVGHVHFLPVGAGSHPRTGCGRWPGVDGFCTGRHNGGSSQSRSNTLTKDWEEDPEVLTLPPPGGGALAICLRAFSHTG